MKPIYQYNGRTCNIQSSYNFDKPWPFTSFKGFLVIFLLEGSFVLIISLFGDWTVVKQFWSQPAGITASFKNMPADS